MEINNNRANKELQSYSDFVILNSGHSIRYYVRDLSRHNVVFVHGFSEGAYVWDHDLIKIPSGFGRISLDLRGHGSSDWNSEGKYCLSEFADDLLAVIHAIDIENIYLIGHSLGAAVCLSAIEKRQQGVVGMILVDYGVEGRSLREPSVTEVVKKMTKNYKTIDSYFNELVEFRPLGRESVLREYANRALRQTPQGDYELKYDPNLLETDIGYIDPVDVLPKLNAPTMILRGAYSSVLSKSEARNQMITNSLLKFNEVPLAGHGIMSENPEYFSEKISSFLQEIRT